MENLLEHYEEWGERGMRLEAWQISPTPFARLARMGRRIHAEWVDHAFEPWLTARDEPARERLRAQLIAICNVQVWWVLTHYLKLERDEGGGAVRRGRRAGRGRRGDRGTDRLSRRRWLIVMGIATVAFFALLAIVDPSRHSAGPEIVAFEFAATRHHAAHMLAEWGPKGRHYARLSLWLDYGFMVSYGAFFTLAGLATRDLARRRGWRRMAALGAVVPFFAAAAALFDASENVALLLEVYSRGGSFGPPFATVCAALKFLLITVAIVYAAVGLLMRFLARGRAPARTSEG